MAELLKLTSALLKPGDPDAEVEPFEFEVDGTVHAVPPAAVTLGAENVFAWATADDDQAMTKAALRGLQRVAPPAAMAALRSLDQADLFAVVTAWLSAGSLGKSSRPRSSSPATKRKPRTTSGHGSRSASE